MKEFRLKPFEGKKDIRLQVPGSKSITNRALLLAALSQGTSVLEGVLFSDDSRVFMKALEDLGYEILVEEEKERVTLTSKGVQIPRDQVEVYVGSAGTAARFLTAMLALSGGSYRVTSSDQMKARPMKELLVALETLGVVFEYEEEAYRFPFKILGRKEGEKKVFLNIDESSQFLSALLLTGVMVEEGHEIQLPGTRDARAYVEISMKMMKDFSCSMEMRGPDTYRILPDQAYEARTYQVEPDVSAACYFYAMAAINGGSAKVAHVHWDGSQGDLAFLHVLEDMGCETKEEEDGILLWGPKRGKLKGLQVNLSNCSDQTMTLAAVAVFAQGPTKIRGVGHIRRQESNRILAIVTELKRFGLKVEEEEDGLTIYPDENLLETYQRGDRQVTFETYEDHRMAMSFALLGTALPGVTIHNPMCCRKTFEKYFQVLTNLGLSSKINVIDTQD